MKESSSSEFVRCKWAIHGIEFSILLFIIALTIGGSVALNKYDFQAGTFTATTTNNTNSTPIPGPGPAHSLSKTDTDKIIAAACLSIIALTLLLFCTINCIFAGCYKSALIGTILSMLIIV